MAGVDASPAAIPKGPVEVTPIGTGAKRIRAKYTCNPDYEPVADCFCVRFSPDEQYLAASFANGAIHVYEAASGKQEFVLNSAESGAERNPLPTTQLRWRPHTAQSKTKSVLISVNCEFDGQICHWHIKSGKCLHTITERGNQLFCLDYFQDGSQFATAGRDRLVRLYDEATKRCVQVLEGGDPGKHTTGHSNRIFALRYHPSQPNIVTSGGWDNTVQVWDARSGHSIRSLWNCYVCGDAIDFSAGGEQMLTGSWRTENALQIWDFGSGRPVESVEWKSASSTNACMLFSSQFSRDPSSSMIVAGGSQENEAKFFHRTGGEAKAFGAMINLPKPVFTVDWAPSASMAAIGSADGQVRVVEIK